MSTNEDMMRNLKSGIQSQQSAADSEADWQDVVHTNHATVSSQQVWRFTYWAWAEFCFEAGVLIDTNIQGWLHAASAGHESVVLEKATSIFFIVALNGKLPFVGTNFNIWLISYQNNNHGPLCNGCLHDVYTFVCMELEYKLILIPCSTTFFVDICKTFQCSTIILLQGSIKISRLQTMRASRRDQVPIRRRAKSADSR